MSLDKLTGQQHWFKRTPLQHTRYVLMLGAPMRKLVLSMLVKLGLK